jgi:hypothetical protein
MVETAMIRSLETLEMTRSKVVLALESCLAVMAMIASKVAMKSTKLLEVLEMTRSGHTKATMLSLAETEKINLRSWR